MMQHSHTQKGFTLVETMFAVFILSIAIAGILTLTSKSIFASRYARNEITANYLLQEAIDSVRNDRDSIAFQKADWNSFFDRYKDCSIANGGCYVEPASATLAPTICNGTCPVFNYDANAYGNDFYTYRSTYKFGNTFPATNFRRSVFFIPNANNPDEIDVRVTVSWINGSLPRSRSLSVSLLRWQ